MRTIIFDVAASGRARWVTRWGMPHPKNLVSCIDILYIIHKNSKRQSLTQENSNKIPLAPSSTFVLTPPLVAADAAYIWTTRRTPRCGTTSSVHPLGNSQPTLPSIIITLLHHSERLCLVSPRCCLGWDGTGSSSLSAAAVASPSSLLRRACPLPLPLVSAALLSSPTWMHSNDAVSCHFFYVFLINSPQRSVTRVFLDVSNACFG